MKKLIYYSSVIFFLIIVLLPIVWAIIISITPEYEMFKNNSSLIPKDPTIANYIEILTLSKRNSKIFITGIINSIKIALITILIIIPFSIMCAYSISRMNFKLKKQIKIFILITMSIPVFTTIIPIYRIYSILSLLDNFLALSLVYISSFLPISVWIISNYFDTIPTEIEEAAYIDGCNKISVIYKIMIPISIPIIVSTFLIVFLMSWGQFQVPLILSSSAYTKPISVVTSEFVARDTIRYGLTTTAGLLAIIPPVILALIFRSFLIKGITNGFGK